MVNKSKESNPFEYMSDVWREKFKASVAVEAESALSYLESRAVPILNQMRVKIDSDSFGLVVSDDLKGHIPAQLLHLVINKRLATKGFDPIEIVFVRATRGILQPDEDANTKIIQVNKKKRILLATEDIFKGRAIKAFGGYFNNFAQAFDIAAFHTYRSKDELSAQGIIRDDTQIFAPSDHGPPMKVEYDVLAAKFSSDSENVRFHDIALCYKVQESLSSLADKIYGEVFIGELG